MRILKKAYMQRALAEEARGHYKQAAAYYSKAKEFEKVGEMYELLGDITRSFSAKIRAYQQAVRWYKEPQHLEQMAARLAKTMEVEIRADQKVSPIELHRLPKVAEYYALAKLWEDAGRIYEELKMYDKATEMYVQGGAIEKVEKLSDRQVEHDQRVYHAHNYYDDGMRHYHAGRRDRAYQLLKECVALDAHHEDAQSVLNTLSRAWKAGDSQKVLVPPEEQDYTLLAKSVISIGRQEDNDLMLPQNDVSRRHVRLGFHQQELVVEDLGSRNGTRLNGLAIQHSAKIRDRDVLKLGLSAQFEVRVRKTATKISATLRSLDREALATQFIVFSGEIQAGDSEHCELRLHDILLNSPDPLFKITYRQPCWYLHFHPHLQDVELNGASVEKYIVILPGDKLSCQGTTLLFE